jgi:hypothetical protein
MACKKLVALKTLHVLISSSMGVGRELGRSILLSGGRITNLGCASLLFFNSKTTAWKLNPPALLLYVKDENKFVEEKN